jgi:hypothetical protein
MSSGKRLSGVLAGLISGTLLAVLFARIKVWNSRKRILKKVDVFAEPFEEGFNEIIDIITVKFDEAKEAVIGLFEQKKIRTVDRERKIRTTPN